VLLQHGADVTVANNNGWTPLYGASSKGHIDVVKVLLQHGADVTVATNDGWTPLNGASSKGHIEVVKVLLQHGADVTVSNNNGWTPLNGASSDGHVEVVKVLLQHGADVAVANDNGWKPLYEASSKGHIGVVKVLLEYGAVAHLTNQEYGNILEAAAYNAEASVIQLLLEVDTDTNLSSDAYGQALQIGCINGNVAVVDALICAGADPSRVDEHGWTSLWCASQFQQDVVMERLLASGGDPSLAARNLTLPPTSWSLTDKSSRLVLNENTATIRYASTEGDGKLKAAAARANHPISIQNTPFYFEITILDSGDTGFIGLGLCSGFTSLDAMPGWNPSSWGYHGDDGNIFDTSGTGKPYGGIFGTGDVVGCCLTCDNEISFTKNGISLGNAMKATAGKLYPVIGMGSRGACIQSRKLAKDNDGAHGTKTKNNPNARWKQKSGIQFLLWPPQSPDLSPIENVWRILKSRVGAKNATSKDELYQFILEEYAAPQFSEGASLDQHGPNQVEDAQTRNVKTLRWLSPRGSAGHNEIKIIQ
ncbi:hypothetical protein V502_03426, partial [Pseudogymnoascus sp. VKM F-4520 (FW-2644)]